MVRCETREEWGRRHSPCVRKKGINKLKMRSEESETYLFFSPVSLSTTTGGSRTNKGSEGRSISSGSSPMSVKPSSSRRAGARSRSDWEKGRLLVAGRGEESEEEDPSESVSGGGEEEEGGETVTVVVVVPSLL